MANNATITWDTITRIQSDINQLMSQNTVKNMMYKDELRQSYQNINNIRIVTMNFPVEIDKDQLSAEVKTSAVDVKALSTYLQMPYVGIYTTILVPQSFYNKSGQSVICGFNLYNDLGGGVKGIQSNFEKAGSTIGYVTISSKQTNKVRLSVQIMFLLFPAQ